MAKNNCSESGRELCEDVGKEASMQSSLDGNMLGTGKAQKNTGMAEAQWKGCQEECGGLYA